MIELIILIFTVSAGIIVYLFYKKHLKEKGIARIYEYGDLFYWEFKGKGYNLTSGWFGSIDEARTNLYEELRKRNII
jgi:hypothetical protein